MQSLLLIVNKVLFNKAILKTSIFIGVISSTINSYINELIPKTFLGMALILWILYGLTIVLDWATGLTAAKYIARKENKEFKFDKTKSTVSFYKNALFIIMMATLYHLQKEAIILKYGKILVNLLTTIQISYFCYNMVLEWLSIETNKFRITNEKSRLYIFLTNLLNMVDKITLQRLKTILNGK